MSVRLRLARHHWTRNNPVYSLVAILAPKRQTAKPLELLGSYKPTPVVVPAPSVSPNGQVRDEKEWGPRQHTPETGIAKVGQKHVEWNLERVRYWLSQGAMPTKRFEKLLIQAGLIKTNPLPQPLPNPRTMVVSRRNRITQAVRAAERERGEIPVSQRIARGEVRR
ncbi:small subunit ribosomal protein S16 [Rhodotorula toruloides]|uniref:Small subunit ribosomal protein S16 n=1 Tax=Rhodotorula toruloides TaxID=5286 RepID=A0A511KME1_RHOTO|nr:small subunit ribosomal protein S16 [Rhodotorula toruloides]